MVSRPIIRRRDEIRRFAAGIEELTISDPREDHKPMKPLRTLIIDQPSSFISRQLP
jgi:hypothetical protein